MCLNLVVPNLLHIQVAAQAPEERRTKPKPPSKREKAMLFAKTNVPKPKLKPKTELSEVSQGQVCVYKKYMSFRVRVGAFVCVHVSVMAKPKPTRTRTLTRARVQTHVRAHMHTSTHTCTRVHDHPTQSIFAVP